MDGLNVNMVSLCEFEHGEPYVKKSDKVDKVLWMKTERYLIIQ
ncbi:hypothetical protein SFC55_20850 [Niallia taxi]